MQLPIGKVPDPDEILEVAFSRARKAAAEARQNVKGSPLIKHKKEDTTRLQSLVANIRQQLQFIQKSFPTFDHLAPFYQELVRCTIDYPFLKQSLGSLPWAEQQVQKFLRLFVEKIKLAGSEQQLEQFRKASFGRISSVVKQLKKNLAHLEDVRKTLREFPTIKTSLQTVVIAGFPNVGKTSLLKAITGSSPEISSYPFTTKKLMLGYKELDGEKVQFIDTPGLLDRPLQNRNEIEINAILALKHLARLVLFVIDPSETSGYSLDVQKRLFKDVKQLDLPIFVIANKSDILTKEQIEAAEKLFDKCIFISAEKNLGIDDVLSMISANISTKSI